MSKKDLNPQRPRMVLWYESAGLGDINRLSVGIPTAIPGNWLVRHEGQTLLVTGVPESNLAELPTQKHFRKKFEASVAEATKEYGANVAELLRLLDDAATMRSYIPPEPIHVPV